MPTKQRYIRVIEIALCNIHLCCLFYFYGGAARRVLKSEKIKDDTQCEGFLSLKSK